MKLKLTLFLVLINLVLFAVLFYMEKVRGAQHGFQVESRLVLPAGFVERVDRIEVRGGTGDVGLVLIREGNRWSVESPVAWPANPFAMENLLHRLMLLEWRNRFSVRELERVGQSLAQYGLEQPQLVLLLNAGDDQLRLGVGATTELGNSLYMLAPDGQQVWVTGRELLYLAASDLAQFHDPRIFSIAPFEARNITVQRAGAQTAARVQLVRAGERWRFETPILAPADQRLVQQALERLNAIEVERFLEPDPTVQGLTNPSVRITVGSGTVRQTLLVGSSAGRIGGVDYLFARLEDRSPVFKVPANAIVLMRNAQESLRQRRVLDVNVQRLNSIEILQGELSLRLQKLESGNWQVVYKDEEDTLRSITADLARVEELIQILMDLEALGFVTDAPSSADLVNFGLDNPQRRVVMRETDGSRSFLQLGQLDAEANLVFANTSLAATVYQVRPFVLSATSLSPLRFRARILSPLPAGGVLVGLELWQRATDAAQSELIARLQGEALQDSGWMQRSRNFPVGEFVRQGVEDPWMRDANTQIEWLQELHFLYRLPNESEQDEVRVATYLLSDRIGGTTRFAANLADQVIFTLPLTVMDALAALEPAVERPDRGINPEDMPEMPPPSVEP